MKFKIRNVFKLNSEKNEEFRGSVRRHSRSKLLFIESPTNIERASMSMPLKNRKENMAQNTKKTRKKVFHNNSRNQSIGPDRDIHREFI